MNDKKSSSKPKPDPTEQGGGPNEPLKTNQTEQQSGKASSNPKRNQTASDGADKPKP